MLILFSVLRLIVYARWPTLKIQCTAIIMKNHSVSKNSFMLLALLLSLLVLPFSGGAAAQQSTGTRQQAPDFTLEDLNGAEVSLSDYRGSVVIMLFWTTW